VECGDPPRTPESHLTTKTSDRIIVPRRSVTARQYLGRRKRIPMDMHNRHSAEGSTTVNRSGSTDEQLRFAIARKHLIELKYNGRTRIAEPHDYGVKNGTRKLLVYQLRAAEAATQKRKPEWGWRLLELSKIEECTVLEQTFAGSRGQSSTSSQAGTHHQGVFQWHFTLADSSIMSIFA
jgi:hypothetical protein